MDYGMSSAVKREDFQNVNMNRNRNSNSSLASNNKANVQEGKLFLGGLGDKTTKDDIITYCQSWGEVSDAVVMENKRFGFVTFEDPKKAQDFLGHRNHQINGKQIEAKAAVPKVMGRSTQVTKKMFVGGCGEMTDKEFKEYFDQFGQIEDAVIVRKDGVSRGFGFVTYKDEISVEKCLVQVHVLPNGKRVDIKRAVPREQMPAMMSPVDVMYHGPSRGRMHNPGHMGMGYNPMDYGMGGYGGYGGYGMNPYNFSGYNMGSYVNETGAAYGRIPGVRSYRTSRYHPY